MKNSETSQSTDQAEKALQCAVDVTVDRRRKLGQHWGEWSGEKAADIHPENAAKSAA